VALDRSFGAPDARAVIARLVSQKHDDLFAGGTAKATVGAFIRNAPAHRVTSPSTDTTKTDRAIAMPPKIVL
jgi:hypothetical protein